MGPLCLGFCTLPYEQGELPRGFKLGINMSDLYVLQASKLPCTGERIAKGVLEEREVGRLASA